MTTNNLKGALGARAHIVTQGATRFWHVWRTVKNCIGLLYGPLLLMYVERTSCRLTNYRPWWCLSGHHRRLGRHLYPTTSVGRHQDSPSSLPLQFLTAESPEIAQYGSFLMKMLPRITYSRRMHPSLLFIATTWQKNSSGAANERQQAAFHHGRPWWQSCDAGWLYRTICFYIFCHYTIKRPTVNLK